MTLSKRKLLTLATVASVALAIAVAAPASAKPLDGVTLNIASHERPVRRRAG